MTSRTRHPLATLLCIGLLFGTAVHDPGPVFGDEAMELLTPPDTTRLTVPFVQLVYTSPSRTPHRLELDGNPLSLETKSAGGEERYVHHVRVPLEVGDHRLTVSGGTGGSPPHELSVTRAARTPRNPAVEPGSGFGFHTVEGEAACLECHPLPAPDQPSPDGTATEAQACAPCHPEVARGAHIHGPAAVGACFACHGTDYNPTRFAPQPALETCGSCHVDVVAEVLGGKAYAHGPAAAGACTTCHEPHGGPSAALLQSPLPQLCLGCHGGTMPREMAESLHGTLVCIECHDPHGAATLALTSASGNRFCSGCHQTVDPVEPGHPLMGHPVTTADGTGREDRPVRCESCHPPHGTADVSKLDIASNEKAQRRFCTGCHS